MSLRSVSQLSTSRDFERVKTLYFLGWITPRGFLLSRDPRWCLTQLIRKRRASDTPPTRKVKKWGKCCQERKEQKEGMEIRIWWKGERDWLYEGRWSEEKNCTVSRNCMKSTQTSSGQSLFRSYIWSHLIAPVTRLHDLPPPLYPVHSFAGSLAQFLFVFELM